MYSTVFDANPDAAAAYTSSGSGAHVLGGATPNVTAMQWFGSTNNVSIIAGDLTLDGSELGLTVQQSDDLSIGSFVDVASTPGTNNLTIDSKNVGSDDKRIFFYRVRN